MIFPSRLPSGTLSQLTNMLVEFSLAAFKFWGAALGSKEV